MEINFEELFNATEIKPGRGHNNQSDAEVSVTKVKQGYAITFRGKAAQRIGERVRVLVSDNAIYFPASKDEGFAACSKSNGIKCVRLTASKTPESMQKFIGDYVLQRMDPVGVPYIQRSGDVKGQ